MGDLGPEAFQFVDFLHSAKQSLWQVLPLGPTGYGDSPYQTFSAFAGNPLLISLEKLLEEGLLSSSDLQNPPSGSLLKVDFSAVTAWKFPLLRKAYENFRAHATASQREMFQSFCTKNSPWLEDFAIFMAIKQAHSGTAWNDWDKSIAQREPEALTKWHHELAVDIDSHKFSQLLFFHQWRKLKEYSHDRSVIIMGDIPIFVSRDSSDVWAHPELFYLDEKGNPTVVAGVPPDYFSATGQLWGNPLYRWELMEHSGFGWWIERFRAAFELFDMVRLDHFRGFEAYWEVPAMEKTAVHGRWVKGPGASLFEAVSKELGDLPIVAENLGVITPEVVCLMEQLGYPGMAVLQFAFADASSASDFLPHNYIRNQLVYTGTHDNNTTIGWWTDTDTRDSTRTAQEVNEERAFALKYLATNGVDMHWTLIRTVFASVANLAIVPLQDLLGLGSEARMNLPARPDGNWRWRYLREMITPEVVERLKEMTTLYGRESKGMTP